MANFYFDVEFNPKINQILSPAKLKIVQILAYSYSNKYIAQDLGLSVKAIEKAMTEVSENLQARSSLYTSRLRVITNLVCNDYVAFKTANDYSNLDPLNDKNQELLLIICCGLSSKCIAKIYNISVKRVEQMVSELYDTFNIETTAKNIENPRILLLISALIKKQLKLSTLKEFFKETQVDRLERIVEDPELFRLKISNNYKKIG
jgi:DNA-binding NarL/FixJ family response regulator